MSDLGQAYVQIVPKATGITNKISNLISPGSAKAGQTAGTSIASGIKKAIIAAGIGAAVGSVIKAAVSEGGKLEQSYGGLETIYGKASEQAKRFAKNAADAGISANDYAEQAVSFGASLKQAFGGDTTKAVQAANTAILDMTDNAAKMGTPIENIQNAYQGFAKQNYTMLDNLKLGYGGTKKEMERLLSDAEKLTGKKYDIENLGDVYEAIHAIQGELGLTGVAAEEAASTLQGSLGALKADWANLLGEMAMGGEEIGPMVAEVVDSASTFLFGNLLPMVGRVVAALPEAVATAIQEGGPQILDSGRYIIGYILAGITTWAPHVADAIPGLIKKISDAIARNGPGLLARGGQLVVSIAKGIMTHAPAILSALTEAIGRLLTYLAANLPQWAMKGAEMLQSLAKSFVEHIPDMLSALGQLLLQIGSFASSMLTAGLELIAGLAEGFLSGVGSLLAPAVKAVVNTVKTVISSIKGFFSSVWASIKATTSAAWNAIKSMASSVWNAIKTAVMTPINAVKTFLSNAWSSIKAKASSAWQAIKSAILRPIEAAKEKVKEIIEKIKGIFPLHIGKIFDAIKLPHISVTGGKAPFGIGGKGSLPKFSVRWAAKGGIVDGATLIGAGEKGAEAIVPLDPFWDKLDNNLGADRIDYDKMAAAMLKALSLANNTTELVCDGRVIARATAPYMQTEMSTLTTRQNRKLGFVGA